MGRGGWEASAVARKDETGLSDHGKLPHGELRPWRVRRHRQERASRSVLDMVATMSLSLGQNALSFPHDKTLASSMTLPCSSSLGCVLYSLSLVCVSSEATVCFSFPPMYICVWCASLSICMFKLVWLRVCVSAFGSWHRESSWIALIILGCRVSQLNPELAEGAGLVRQLVLGNSWHQF